MNNRGTIKNQKNASSNQSKKNNNKVNGQSHSYLRKLQSEFITSVSHQFLTPLSSLLSSVELLEFYIRKENYLRQEEIINRIKKSIKILNETLSRLTEFYKYHSTNQKIKKEKIHLRKFINEILEEVAVIIGDSHIIIVNIQDDIINIVSDEFLLKQIIINLINNAVKFSPNGGQIRLDVFRSKLGIKFSVKDEGIGISKSDLKKLFEPFFRGGNAVSIPGVGLGLTIVKNFTELLKGHIECKSKVNEGSEFILTIPD